MHPRRSIKSSSLMFWLTRFWVQFWRLTPSHHLIRPVSMRANHPIVPCPASSSIMKAKRPRAAPSRARRRVIDPSRWDPMHLSKSSFSEYQPAKSQADETWDYESLEDDEEADEDGRAVLGVWRRVVDGEVVEEEVVRGTRLRTSLGSLGNDKDLADNPNTEIFADEQRARPRESTLVDKETSPLFANRHLPLQIPDPAENRSVSPAAESMAESAPSSPLLPQREMSPHSTPPSRPVESARNAEHGPATSLPAPILELAREERSTALQVFGSLLGDVASGHRDPGGNTKKRNEWAGFEESYEEDEEATTPLRLRGGAGSTSSNDSSESGHEDDSTSEDDSSDEEDRSSQDEDEDMDETDETGDGEESADPDPPLTAKPNTLKSLFDPSASTTGTSLPTSSYHADIV